MAFCNPCCALYPLPRIHLPGVQHPSPNQIDRPPDFCLTNACPTPPITNAPAYMRLTAPVPTSNRS